MRDVAKRAGVSFKTVSRVINGEPGVSPELTARVNAAVGELDYRPDQRARLLRRSSNHGGTIGFVLVDVANPFFGSLLRGIEEEATARDCLVLAGSTEGSAQRERQLIEAFVGRRVDGLIVVSSEASSGPLRSELDRGTPVVFLDLEPDVDDIDLVRSDHLAGATTATRHLLDHGHEDIAYFGDDIEVFSARLRRQGFVDAMGSAGIAVPEHRVVTGSHSEDAWADLVRSHIRTHGAPTAVFTAQNFVTLGAIRALHGLGLRDRVAMVGFDDIDLANVIQPGITVIPQYPRDLGRRAAAVLFGRIEGDAQPPIRDIIAPPLITRGSGELPPAPGAARSAD